MGDGLSGSSATTYEEDGSAMETISGGTQSLTEKWEDDREAHGLGSFGQGGTHQGTSGGGGGGWYRR